MWSMEEMWGNLATFSGHILKGIRHIWRPPYWIYPTRPWKELYMYRKPGRKWRNIVFEFYRIKKNPPFFGEIEIRRRLVSKSSLSGSVYISADKSLRRGDVGWCMLTIGKRMRSSLVVRASDCQCTSCNGPGFDPSSGIWGAAYEAVLNIVSSPYCILWWNWQMIKARSSIGQEIRPQSAFTAFAAQASCNLFCCVI